MRQLNEVQSLIFLLGGLLMAVGAGCCAFMWHAEILCWVYLAGAVMFVSMQVLQKYEGDSFVIRRLRRIMLLSDFFFILAGISMADTQYGFLRGLFTSMNDYIDYAYNKWVPLLLAGAIIQLYTTHRISHELEK